MINSKALQLLLLVSSMASQVVGMMPQEISSMTLRMKKMGENLGMMPPELKRQIISSALELKLNQNYTLYKKLDVGSEVTGIAFNGDTTRILTGSWDGVARLWDVKKGIVIKELKGHTERIRSVALSADSLLLLQVLMMERHGYGIRIQEKLLHYLN